MQGPPQIYCQGAYGRKASRTTEPGAPGAQRTLAGDPDTWLEIRLGCILGTLRSAASLEQASLFTIQHTLLWVDVAARPDVYDLGRVLRREGSGEASCRWSRCSGYQGAQSCVLSLLIQRPVRASFGLLFPLPDTIQLLASIAYTHSLVLCFGEPARADDIGTTVSAASLSEMLTADTTDLLSLQFDWQARDDLHTQLAEWITGWAY